MPGLIEFSLKPKQVKHIKQVSQMPVEIEWVIFL